MDFEERARTHVPELTWYKVSSMDKKLLKDVSMVCMGMGIKFHFADDGINPPAIWFLTIPGKRRLILSRVGLFA